MTRAKKILEEGPTLLDKAKALVGKGNYKAHISAKPVI